MLADVDYWQSVYASAAVPFYPPLFAVFVQSWLCSASATLIKVGCGNGRDFLFIHGLGHGVVVTDQIICDELSHFASNNNRFVSLKESADFKKTS